MLKKIALGLILSVSVVALTFGTEEAGGKRKKGKKAQTTCTAEEKAKCDKEGKKCCAPKSDASAAATEGKKCCAAKES